MRIASRSVFVIVSLHPPNGDQSARTRKLLIPPRWPSVLYPADLRLGSSSKQTYASACPLWIAENKARGLLLDGPRRREAAICHEPNFVNCRINVAIAARSIRMLPRWM